MSGVRSPGFGGSRRTPPPIRRVDEFYAPCKSVSALALGQHSSRVFATGGDDCRINVWALGNPTPRMCFGGHTTPITSMAFDHKEMHLCAGSEGGSIRLWDLGHSKLLRTLAGHRAAVTCLDHHPHGEFFVSGGADCNVKVWDSRKKSSMQMYTGHRAAITGVLHSPDGRWVVTGDAAGVVHVWDLTAGKLITQLSHGKKGVSCLSFHPDEFVMATGGQDKVVKFWDMETMNVISKTSLDTLPMRKVLFTGDGEYAVCVTNDSLRVWEWEAAVATDAVASCNWGPLGDVSFRDQRTVVTCSVSGNLVSVYEVDVQDLRPFNKKKRSPAPVGASPPLHMKLANSLLSSNGSSPESKSTLSVQGQRVPPQVPSPTPPQRPAVSVSSPQQQPPPQQVLSQHQPYGSPYSTQQATQRASPAQQPEPVHERKHTVSQAVPATSPMLLRALKSVQDVSTTSPKALLDARSVTEHKGIGLDPSAFLRTVQLGQQLSNRPPEPRDHMALSTALTQRLGYLRVLRSQWAQGRVREVCVSLGEWADVHVTADFLTAVQRRMLNNDVWTLSMCHSIQPALLACLKSPVVRVMTTGLVYCHFLVAAFAGVLADLRSSQRHHQSLLSSVDEDGRVARGTAVNLAQEERFRKCDLILSVFRQVAALLEHARLADVPAGQFRHVQPYAQWTLREVAQQCNTALTSLFTKCRLH